MTFYQIEFLVLLVAVLALVAVSRAGTPKKLILLGASYYFYAHWDYRLLGVVLVSTVVDYSAGLVMDRSQGQAARKWALMASLAVNLGLLGFFKYANFFIDQMAAVLTPLGLGVSHLDIILPLGISFYTFQTLSYTIDVYRGRMAATRSLLDYALFVAFFPKIVAGPVIRAADFLPQLARDRRVTREDLAEGFRLYAMGLFKKVFIADRVGPFVDFAFTNIQVMDSATAWLAALGYSLQLYCDFSGYSDMAIGIGRMLGYDLGVNFNFPYLAKNISDFWRRWHISLSTWIRDYLYIPLGGSRSGPVRTQVNLLVAMTLCGLWHGSAWTFVFWGFYHGLALVAHRLWKGWRPTGESGSGGMGELAGWVATLLVVVVGWVFFRAESFAQAALVLHKMFIPTGGTQWLHPFVIGALVATALVHAVHVLGLTRAHLLPMRAWYTPAVLFCLVWLAVIFFPKGFSPFIYARF